jgi:hypothetical protein
MKSIEEVKKKGYDGYLYQDESGEIIMINFLEDSKEYKLGNDKKEAIRRIREEICPNKKVNVFH